MKLTEIFLTEATTSRQQAAENIIHYIHSLGPAYEKAFDAIENAKATYEPGRERQQYIGFRIGSIFGKWTAENYLGTSGKREAAKRTSGLANDLSALGFKDLGTLTVLGVKDSGTWSNIFKQLQTGGLSRLKSVNNKDLQRAVSYWETLINKLNDKRAEAAEDQPSVAPTRTERSPRQPNVNPQIEQIINQKLAELPRDIAGEIRNEIARAGNKLIALRTALQRRGIE